MKERALGRDEILALIEAVGGEDMHAKRIPYITNAVLGVVHVAALSIHAIGIQTS